MATTKERMNKLIQWADDALQDQVANADAGISKVLNKGEILDSYNGSVAALSVSIAMGGLRPALAIYYQEKSERGASPKANRRSVLDVIARIITIDTYNQWNFADGGLFAKNMFRYSIEHDDEKLKQEVIDCSIALKQVVRTYNLVKS
jgi:hypothetical protein